MSWFTTKSVWSCGAGCCNKMYKTSVQTMYSNMYREYKRVVKHKYKMYKVIANTYNFCLPVIKSHVCHHCLPKRNSYVSHIKKQIVSPVQVVTVPTIILKGIQSIYSDTDTYLSSRTDLVFQKGGNKSPCLDSHIVDPSYSR